MHTIVIDFDGTLVDSNKIKRQGFLNFASSDIGGEAIMSRILGEVPGDRARILSAYLQERAGRACGDGELLNALKTYNNMVDEAVISAPEMFGATELLSTLRQQGLRLVLSSATPEENLSYILIRRGWLSKFDAVFGKPREKIDTLQCLISTTTSVKQITVIGDGEDDKRSAEEIGCRFFPVGDAKGIAFCEKIYTLPEICNLLSSEVKMRERRHE